MMRLVFTPLAIQDLEAIGDYIAANNPARAVSFIQELRKRCAMLVKRPQSYRARPELGSGIHSCVHRNYIIFFAADSNVIRVIRILHSAQDLSAHFQK